LACLRERFTCPQLENVEDNAQIPLRLQQVRVACFGGTHAQVSGDLGLDRRLALRRMRREVQRQHRFGKRHCLLIANLQAGAQQVRVIAQREGRWETGVRPGPFRLVLG